MSMAVTTEVWSRWPEGGGSLLLALALADYADDTGGSIYPSVPTLARECRVSHRHVQRLLRRFAVAGWIRYDGPGPRGTRRYRLILSALPPAGAEGDMVSPSAPEGDIRAGVRVTPVSPDLSVVDLDISPPTPSREREGERETPLPGGKTPTRPAARAECDPLAPHRAEIIRRLRRADARIDEQVCARIRSAALDVLLEEVEAGEYSAARIHAPLHLLLARQREGARAAVPFPEREAARTASREARAAEAEARRRPPPTPVDRARIRALRDELAAHARETAG